MKAHVEDVGGNANFAISLLQGGKKRQELQQEPLDRLLNSRKRDTFPSPSELVFSEAP